MRVIGYTYDADQHCVDCTEEYVKANNTIDGHIPNADDMDAFRSGEWEVDDSEGNPLHPIFDTDEAGDTPDHCSDCGLFIDTSWIDTTVDYAVQALADYVVNGDGNIEVLDVWAENLNWCNMDNISAIVKDAYSAKRSKEEDS
jgi:hypothetical protein